ncbi:prothymosin alpha [Crotalus tigris]|uniref:prothymosin alpha n=1 Tax=Crotalus tigris TaxID=88082 RepID=UPI00192F1C86|nr:prothymosin alpha [Crotalus tigris]
MLSVAQKPPRQGDVLRPVRAGVAEPGPREGGVGAAEKAAAWDATRSRPRLRHGTGWRRHRVNPPLASKAIFALFLTRLSGLRVYRRGASLFILLFVLLLRRRLLLRFPLPPRFATPPLLSSPRRVRALGSLPVFGAPFGTSRGLFPPHNSAAPALSDTAVDTSSEISTKDLKEKKEVVEETENGRDAPANGNAENEENGEQEADNEVDDEEEEVGDEEEDEEEGDGEEEDGDEDDEAEGLTGKRAAEDDEDDDVDPKKQKTDEDD